MKEIAEVGVTYPRKLSNFEKPKRKEVTKRRPSSDSNDIAIG